MTDPKPPAEAPAPLGQGMTAFTKYAFNSGLGKALNDILNLSPEALAGAVKAVQPLKSVVSGVGLVSQSAPSASLASNAPAQEKQEIPAKSSMLIS